MLYGENLENPEAQVGMVRDFLTNSLRGRIADEVLGPYLAMLDREGAEFAYYRMKNPDANDITFGQWMVQKYGPTGGL
jgi:hypothetical protein